MKKFVLLGAAGFVAPRHYRAIKDVGGELVAICDPSDSVGVVDSYFPEAYYFNEFERFDRYCSKRGDINYVSICSPNYLHDAHCRFALRIGADAICEKPMVLRERNLDELLKLEEQTGKRVWNILQLRLGELCVQHIPMWLDHNTNPYLNVAIEYFAPRGRWYDYSWKMNSEKSGGLISNIGIHLLDLICFFFGGDWEVSYFLKGRDKREVSFTLRSRANDAVTVSVELSLNRGEKRVLAINDTEFNLTPKMKELHTRSYVEILEGRGFGIEDARPAIALADKLRRCS